jgi:hypothetical protein
MSVVHLPPVSVLFGGAAFGGALKASGFVADIVQDAQLRRNWRGHLGRTLRSPSIAAFVLSKSLLFGVASTTKQACLSVPGGDTTIPGTGGLVGAVAITGIAFGATGAVVDWLFLTNAPSSHIQTPLWLGQVAIRALPLGAYYIACDYAERLLPEPVGSTPFLRGGLGGVIAAATAFPLQRMHKAPLVTEPPPRGLSGLYRGFGLPTVLRPFFVLGSALQTFAAVESSVRHRWSA